MELISTNSKCFIDLTTRLKFSSVPIISYVNNNEYVCYYCKNKFSRISSKQSHCKNCLFDYANDNNVDLDIHTCIEKTQCVEYEPRNEDFRTQNIQKWIVHTESRCYLTTKIIFKITEQHGCKKYERFVTIDITGIGKWLKDLKDLNITSNHHQITKYMNNLIQNLGTNKPFYSINVTTPKIKQYLKYFYVIKANKSIMLNPFSNNMNTSTHISNKIRDWNVCCWNSLNYKRSTTRYLFDVEEHIQTIQSEIYKNLIYYHISFKKSDYNLVSCGSIGLSLTKEMIPILHLPWWDTFSICTACRQKLEYISDFQKWCSRCFIIYSGCRYCLTTSIIYEFTNQSQCIKCKRTESVHINGNYIKTEFLNSEVDTNSGIVNYRINVDKDNNSLNFCDFILDKLRIVKNIKKIKYFQIKDLKRIAKGGFGIIYKATWKNSTINKIVAVKRFLNSQIISKDFINEVKIFLLLCYFISLKSIKFNY
jgi:hypothetical protein